MKQQKTLYYFPLEQYPERYTSMMSCKGGWAEDNFKRHGVKFVRIEGRQISSTIRNGCVLDAAGRCAYSMSQLTNFITNYLKAVKDGDVVYVEDFWHPGIESLFYIRALTGIRFRIGCFCHAQSVDDSDFTHKMKDWMRPIEQGFARQYDFIFTCSPILKRLLREAGVGKNNIHVVGLPFNSVCLRRQLKKMGMRPALQKERYVIFSSRFDDEKDPMFFLDVVEACPDIQFRLVSPYSSRPPSTNEIVMRRLKKIVEKRGSNLRIVDTSSKVRYYECLSKAWVQFNCAIQDWVSWTLVEATMFNCHPLYPNWKDFPRELHNRRQNIYRRKDLADCVAKLRRLMSLYDKGVTGGCSFVYKKHDMSWGKYLKIMGFN